MSAGSLFHTVAAATAKALVPMTVFGRCINSFICTESVLKIMDAGYCLYVHIFVFF